MTDNEQRAAAKKFAQRWKNKGYEKGESQLFWIELLEKVYGVEEPSEFVIFEEQVHLDHTSFIDVMIPSPTDTQREKIERIAQAILDARALYPDCSFADLYDDLTMPPELRKAHQANDIAVMVAYGFSKDSPAFSSESACVAELMRMYQELIK